MLSIDTDRKLAEIFLDISTQEREVEERRYYLSKNMDFEPASVFKALDQLEIGSISSSEVQDFLQKHHVFCSNDEAYLVIRQYDTNMDGRLSFQEFVQFSLPCTNPGLRQLSLSRRGFFTTEVEYLFRNLLQAEVLFHRTIEGLKREIVLRPDFNLLEAFRSVDIRNSSSIDRTALMVFLRRYRAVVDEDLDAIFRRVDNDGDGIINYSEFVDCIMPSRSNFTRQTREVSPKDQSYRNASPLRNSNSSQFSFRKTYAGIQESSPERNMRSLQANTYSPLRSNGNGHSSSFNKELSPRHSVPLRSSQISMKPSSPLRSVVRETSFRDYQNNPYVPERIYSPRHSSPLRKSSPLKNSSTYDREPLRASNLSQTLRSPPRDVHLFSDFNNTDLKSENRHSSPLRNSSFHEHSPLRAFNLSQSMRSPPRTLHQTSDFAQTTEFRPENRRSSPLRRASPEKPLAQESRTLELSRSSNFNASRATSNRTSSEEQEIVAAFHEEIKFFREIETSKNTLALKHDFNLIDAFRMFDKYDLGMISVSDIEETFNCLSLRPNPEEIYLLVRHYSHLQDSRLRFADFSEILTPKHEDYSRILRNRNSLNVPNGERMRVFSRDTLSIFCNTLRLILNAESLSERLRQRLSKMPEFSLFQAFNSVDKDRNGYITINEFQDILNSHGILASSKDLQGLMQKYDKNRDGRVSYSEFVEEVTPKSPKKY